MGGRGWRDADGIALLFYKENSELAFEDTVIRKKPDVAFQLLIHLISRVTINVLGWCHNTMSTAMF